MFFFSVLNFRMKIYLLISLTCLSLKSQSFYFHFSPGFVEVRCFDNLSVPQTKAAEGDAAAWDGFRASLRLLHPAFVLPLSPDLFNLNSDLSSLPPPPPPPPTVSEEGDTTAEEPATDSPMM